VSRLAPSRACSLMTTGLQVDAHFLDLVDEETLQPIWKVEKIPSKGQIPVNMIVGQTGMGKTSMIQMLCGAGPTITAGGPDTKKPCVYGFKREGKTYYVLDTAGLADNRSTDEGRMESNKQLVEFVRRYNLSVKRVFLTYRNGCRFDGSVADGIPALFDCLGGFGNVVPVCCWVVTSLNKDSERKKALTKAAMENDGGTVRTLQNHDWNLCVTVHGEENQDEMKKEMASSDDVSEGLDTNAMTKKDLSEEVATLSSMGFQMDAETLSLLLQQHDGDFEKVVNHLLPQ